jgi:hypothetical protein
VEKNKRNRRQIFSRDLVLDPNMSTVLYRFFSRFDNGFEDGNIEIIIEKMDHSQ